MTRLSKRTIAFLAPLSDEQLRDQWEKIGTLPLHRVKKTNIIKWTWIKWSETLLAELRRRRLDAEVCADCSGRGYRDGSVYADARYYSTLPAATRVVCSTCNGAAR